MPDQEFFNFDEALDELKLKEEELKRLVSEGEIRAFREGETMRLRRADVENLKRELLGGGEVVDLGGSGEELVFEDDADFEEAGMATEEIPEMDTLLEDDVEDVGELDIEETEPLGAPGVAVAAAPVRRASAAAAEEAETESIGLRVAMLVTSLVLLLAVPIAVSVSTGHASDLAKTIAGIFGNEF